MTYMKIEKWLQDSVLTYFLQMINVGNLKTLYLVY